MECNETHPYTFTTEVLCDEKNTEQGKPRILSTDTATCDYKVVVSHDAGCPAG